MKCDVCGKTIVTEPGDIGTGYARHDDLGIVCYACCGVLDTADLNEGKPVTLYLTKDDQGRWVVSNWCGTMKVRVRSMSVGKHSCFGGYVQRTDVWFSSPDSKLEYWGVNRGDMQLIRCKRIAAFTL